MLIIRKRWIIMKFKVIFHLVGKWMVNSRVGGEKGGKILVRNDEGSFSYIISCFFGILGT